MLHNRVVNHFQCTRRIGILPVIGVEGHGEPLRDSIHPNGLVGGQLGTEVETEAVRGRGGTSGGLHLELDHHAAHLLPHGDGFDDHVSGLAIGGRGELHVGSARGHRCTASQVHITTGDIVGELHILAEIGVREAEWGRGVRREAVALQGDGDGTISAMRPRVAGEHPSRRPVGSASEHKGATAAAAVAGIRTTATAAVATAAAAAAVLGPSGLSALATPTPTAGTADGIAQTTSEVSIEIRLPPHGQKLCIGIVVFAISQIASPTRPAMRITPDLATLAVLPARRREIAVLAGGVARVAVVERGRTTTAADD